MPRVSAHEEPSGARNVFRHYPRDIAALFAVGAARSLVTVDRWWNAGLEMLGLGIIVAAAAYWSGALAAWALG